MHDGSFDGDETNMLASSAVDTFTKLGIRSHIPKWVENSKYWMFQTFIPQLLNDHFQNLQHLNNILAYFKRRLIFGPINPFEQNHDYDPDFHNKDPITLQELIEFAKREPNPEKIWSMKPNISINQRQLSEFQIKSNLIQLIKQRISIEKYFIHPSYGTEIRFIIHFSLLNFMKGLRHSEIYGTQIKLQHRVSE